MTGSILGNRVIRKEDPKFLTTGGVYVDDMDEPLLEGALHVTYARSTMAHARITGIDTAAAAEAPGVVAVYTAADLGLEPVPAAFNPMPWPARFWPATSSGTSASRSPPSSPSARTRARTPPS